MFTHVEWFAVFVTALYVNSLPKEVVLKLTFQDVLDYSKLIPNVGSL